MHIANILAPVDFSTASRLALDHGIAFSRKFGARLTLLNVTELPLDGPVCSTGHEREDRKRTS